MKKILLNAYMNLNFGDDLFLKIIFDRYPNVNWVLPKGGKKYKEVFKNYNNVTVSDNMISKIKNKLGINIKNSLIDKYDAGVYVGGSIFMEIEEWKKQLKNRKDVIDSFTRKGKPYFILGSNFGPYSNEEFLKEYKYLFTKCTDICLRDMYSFNLFKEYNNVRIAPDIVFQLKAKRIKKIKDSIGISLIEINNREDLSAYNNIYIQKISNIIEEGIKRGKTFTLFSFCEAQGDLRIINDVVSRLSYEYRDKLEVVNYTGNIDEFLQKFESMENIIGSRFHACILSQVFEQGLYPILYSNKTYNVLKDIGLDKEYKFIKDLENLDVKEVLNRISNNKITDKKIFKEAEKQFEVLDKYVRS